MKKLVSVAIDGPAGSGKSAASKLLAQRLGWLNLETGALYRAITAYCLGRNLVLADERNIEQAICGLDLRVEFENQKQHVIVNGVDLTSKLRLQVVDNNVAIVAKVADVRKCVLKVQREIAATQNVVVEGRDIGTVVLPESVNKFFLTAAPEIRAHRRFIQLLNAGDRPSYGKILQEIKERDRVDQSRKISPLLPAKDAKVIDTSNLALEEVVDRMMSMVTKRCAEHSIEK